MPVITPDQAGGANVCAFLDMLAFSEGTSTHPLTQHDGYDVIVTSVDGPAVFTDFTQHPFYAPLGQEARGAQLIRRPCEQWPKGLYSTASGRYQVLCHYFETYKLNLRLPDFSPLSQDKVAIQQMRERGALVSLAAGDIETAIRQCAPIWASLPGNDYHQGGKTLAELVSSWEEAKGKL